MYCIVRIQPTKSKLSEILRPMFFNKYIRMGKEGWIGRNLSLRNIETKKPQAKLKYLGMHTWVNKIIFKCREVINIEVRIMVTLLSIIT